MLRPDFSGPGLEATWLIFVVNGILLAGLLAATLIDARHFIIPLQIPWTITLIAFVLLPTAVAMWPWAVRTIDMPGGASGGGGGAVMLLPSERLAGIEEPYRHAAAVRVALQTRSDEPVRISAAPLVSSRAATMAIGSLAGLILANVLLWFGILPRSFDDEPVSAGEVDHHAADDPEAWLQHPHPRREVLKECVFLSLPAAGAVIGYLLAFDEAGLIWRAIGGTVLGYLAGALTVWATRIGGTLGFGKEAMGLGDVHLMGAVGAVCGWQVGVVAFFVAPFIGLTWTAGAAGISKLLHREIRIIPYGPHLAAATVAVMVMREPVMTYFGMLMGG
jgi:leader peptidase (prepilin peptidase)/N-methyltransferase